jgi:hypothetical protein
MVLQPYGGEMLLRAYLFSLPFVVFFAAAVFLPLGRQPLTLARTAVLGLVSVALLAGLFFTRFGNEKIAHYTFAERQAVERLYATAPPGSLLVATSSNLPWKGEKYATYDYELLPRLLEKAEAPTAMGTAQVVPVLERYMRTSDAPRAYVISTRSLRNYDALLGAKAVSATDLQRALSASPRFRKVLDNGDAVIFSLAPNRAGR